MSRIIFFVAILISACSKNREPLNNINQEKLGHYYEIEGFYVWPITNVLIGATRDDVKSVLGLNPQIYKKTFIKPMRVDLNSLPEFDEEWCYSYNMSNKWVFFKQGKVVAAFYEASDW